MASTSKTSLGLNQWILSDKPRMEDFNSDNKIINAELVKKTNAPEVKVYAPKLLDANGNDLFNYEAQSGQWWQIGKCTYVSYTILITNIISTAATGGLSLTMPVPCQGGGGSTFGHLNIDGNYSHTNTLTFWLAPSGAIWVKGRGIREQLTPKIFTNNRIGIYGQIFYVSQ